MLPSGRTSYLFAPVLFVGLAALPAGPTAAQEDKVPSPTGRIVYRVSSAMMNGTQTLAWADNGKKVRQDTDSQVNPGLTPGAPAAPGGARPQGMAFKSWVIVDGGFAYISNPMMGPAVRRMDLKKVPGQRTGPGGVPNITVGKDLGKLIGKATIAGKPCNIHELKNREGKVAGKVWVWKNLPMKLEVQSGQGAIMLEATQVEVPAKVDAAIFKLPKGVQVQDFDPTKMPAGGMARPKLN